MTHTHQQLCDIAVRWLKRPINSNGHGCQIAISEPKARSGESPDAVGFKSGSSTEFFAGCVVVECKTSRSDFLVDKKKPWRKANQGIGKFRYFMCPENLIKVDELPAAWGLIYVNQRGHCKVVAGALHDQSTADLYAHTSRDFNSEQSLLIDWLSRVGDPEKVALDIRQANNTAQQHFKRVEKEQADNHHMRSRLEQSIAACTCGKAHLVSRAYLIKMREAGRVHVWESIGHGADKTQEMCSLCSVPRSELTEFSTCRGRIIVTPHDIEALKK